MAGYTVTLDGREYDVDAPDERTAYRWGKKFHEGFKQRVAAETERARKEYDPTKDMSGWDKTFANIGAGMANFGQGARQLGAMVGIGEGPSDEEIKEKRALDEQLAEGTQAGIDYTGPGADYVPRLGKALQFVGEAAPTLAIPGVGVVGNVGRVATKFLPRMLPQAMQAGRLAKVLGSATTGAAASGAVGGAGVGALQPVTEDESRAWNIAGGAAAGAALPLGWAATKATGRGIASAARGTADLFTEKGARRGAAKILGAEPGAPPPVDPATLATEGAEKVPLSTAALYGDDELARLELASRARGGAHKDWADFDRAQRQAVAENVEAGTARAGTEKQARLDRQAAWDQGAAEAAQNVDPQAWQGRMANLRASVEAAKRTPQGANQMRGVLNEIGSQMDELGGDFSPLHLAELRARMGGKVSGSPTDPFRSAPVTDKTYISLRKEFDNILNEATGNKWEDVLQGYKQGSVPVAQGKAETAVERHFYTPEGTARTPSSEGTPTITEANLRKAITLPEMQNVYGTAPTFAPESSRVLKGTLEALERQNIQQRTKGTQTGGGGSMTSPLAMALQKLHPWIGKGAQFVGDFARARQLRELDRALRDPQYYRQLMEEASRSR